MDKEQAIKEIKEIKEIRKRVEEIEEIEVKHRSKYYKEEFMYGDLLASIVNGRFNFSLYWAECQFNSMKKLKEEDVWMQLAKDIIDSIK